MQRQRALAFSLLLVAGMALGGCETTGDGPPAAQAAPAQPMTHQQAALDCWMSTEKQAASLGIDKRADLVTKCINDKMKGAGSPEAAAPGPGAAPAGTTAPKPKT